MAKRIKWTAEGISFARGNYEALVARLDNCSKWILVGAICSTSTFKSDIRRFAQTFGATEVEIKSLYKDDKLTVPSSECVAFRSYGDGRYYIFKEGNDKNIEVQPKEIFS